MKMFVALLIAGVLILLMIMAAYNYYPEHFQVPYDDYDLSEHDNISLTEDVDSLLQIPDTKFTELESSDSDSQSLNFDNSDLVDQIVSGGDTVFHPAHGRGVSTTSNASMNPLSLGAATGLPYFDDLSMFDSPTNGQINIDEKLAISQQHRGSIAKKAMDGYVRSTRNLYEKYFSEELDQNSNREWWDDSGNSLETDFGQDISMF
jgi:hypothetical protein